MPSNPRLERLLLALFGLGFDPTVHAMCPEKPVQLCEIVRMNSFVAHAKVAETQFLVDEDDPIGRAGVFAGPDAEGNLETGNYCNPYTKMEFSLEFEKQVKACLAAEKKVDNPNNEFQRTPAGAAD